jgi:hypothetical protein
MPLEALLAIEARRASERLFGFRSRAMLLRVLSSANWESATNWAV